jgi:4'-phosphopantetheinyl transferase
MALALPIAASRPSAVPTGDAVHIWTVRHDDARSHDEDARCLAVLSDAEVAQFNRLTNVRQRARRVHARAALRHILSSYLGTNPARIAIHAGVHGKPRVAGVEFNCSHAPSLTLVAVASQPIGVDVEPITACEGIDAIGHRFINEVEYADIVAMPAGRAPIEMLRLWVIKEACLKAIGTGLATDPRELCVRHASPAVFDVSRGADALRARLVAVPGHVAAVAARTLDHLVLNHQAELQGRRPGDHPATHA